MSRYRTVFACFLLQRGYDATSPYSPYDLPVTTNPPANPQNLPTQSLPHRGRCPEGAEGVAAEHASNHRPSGESAPGNPLGEGGRRSRDGGSPCQNCRFTPSVLALRPNQLPLRGSLRLRTTQSLPHRGRCPEGAEGVAAEHASNHRPSGESAPGNPLGEGGRRSRDGGSPCQNCRFTPSVLALRPNQLPLRGSLRLRTTQSLPHRGRCPEGAEGVAAEHASNHRPSGESAKPPSQEGGAPKGRRESISKALPQYSLSPGLAASQLPQRGSLRLRTHPKPPSQEGGAPKGRRELQQNTPATTNPPANPPNALSVTALPCHLSQRERQEALQAQAVMPPLVLPLGEHHRHSLRSLLSEARLRERRSRTHHFYASHTSPSGVRA